MTCLKTRHGLVRQMNCSAIVQSMGRVAFGFAGNKTNFKIYETTFKTDRYLPNPFHLCKDLWKFENRIRCFLFHSRRTIRKNDWEKGTKGILGSEYTRSYFSREFARVTIFEECSQKNGTH